MTSRNISKSIKNISELFAFLHNLVDHWTSNLEGKVLNKIFCR
jgi:hypothetical protein